MNNSEILERARKEVDELADGDVILLLDAAAEGCINSAFAVANGAAEPLEVESDCDEEGSVSVMDGGKYVAGYEFVNNRIRELDTADDARRVVYLNVGKRSVAVEGGAVRPGAGGSFTPVNVTEALRACGYYS